MATSFQQLNRDNGLQNNTVLSLNTDQSGNLWLGLDNGVDYIELNSPLSYISSDEGISTGYCSIVHNNMLYLGTNQGLFARPFNPSVHSNAENFELVPGTEGQVWSLKVINNKLFCGHHVGTFIIEGKKATQISEEPGGWTFIQLSDSPEFAIGGNYSGISLYHFEANQWKFVQKITGFSESSRFLTEDKSGDIWVSHGARGVFRVSLNAQHDSATAIKMYGSKEGLPQDQLNILLNIGDSWYISTVDGIYSYNNTTDRF